jgi:hypothetical protein
MIEIAWNYRQLASILIVIIHRLSSFLRELHSTSVKIIDACPFTDMLFMMIRNIT